MDIGLFQNKCCKEPNKSYLVLVKHLFKVLNLCVLHFQTFEVKEITCTYFKFSASGRSLKK